jgi:hypothetical protein
MSALSLVSLGIFCGICISRLVAAFLPEQLESLNKKMKKLVRNAVKPGEEPGRDVIGERLARAQWEVIENRLDKLNAPLSSWWKPASRCLGTINLECGPWNKRPMPLVESVRERLERMGFVISLDGLEARYTEAISSQ